jgi:SM-20-related protein
MIPVLDHSLEKKLLDLSRLTAAWVRKDPFQWARLEGLIDKHDLDTLCQQFPTSGFQETTGHSQDKEYRMFCRTLLPRGHGQSPANQSLSIFWQRLSRELASAAYRVAIERLTGLDLKAHEIEINLWVYGRDCWLAPHCDKPAKVVSHVLYFSPHWDVEWGGNLRILRSRELSDYAEEIPPTAGDSVVLLRGDQSWHAVTPVTGRPDRPRRSMQVVFWTPSGSG